MEGGSEAQHLFGCVNTHLVSPCTTRHVYVGAGPNPSSVSHVLPARSSSPRLPTGVSQDPRHLGHRSQGALVALQGAIRGL